MIATLQSLNKSTGSFTEEDKDVSVYLGADGDEPGERRTRSRLVGEGAPGTGDGHGARHSTQPAAGNLACAPGFDIAVSTNHALGGRRLLRLPHPGSNTPLVVIAEVEGRALAPPW